MTQRSPSSSPDSTPTKIARNPQYRFFVEKLRALNISVGEDLRSYYVPIEFVVVVTRFPSHVWDEILSELVERQEIRDALASVAMTTDMLTTRDFLVEALGRDTIKQAINIMERARARRTRRTRG